MGMSTEFLQGKRKAGEGEDGEEGVEGGGDTGEGGGEEGRTSEGVKQEASGLEPLLPKAPKLELKVGNTTVYVFKQVSNPLPQQIK